MSSRSLNKAVLIGNLTRDPELRYTPQGNAVCSFGLATNRSWQPQDGGERREETEFHRCVAWNKLAELCSQLLSKGRKVYLEGRLQTRSWDDKQTGQKKYRTEIVAENIQFGPQGGGAGGGAPTSPREPVTEQAPAEIPTVQYPGDEEEIKPEDIPF